MPTYTACVGLMQPTPVTMSWSPSAGLQGNLGRGLLLYGQHKQACLAELLAGPAPTPGTRYAVAQVG